MSFASAVHRKAIELGKLSVEMTTSAGSGHPSSSLSLAHLVTVLLYHQMRWDPKDPWHPSADRLVLSEGHAVPIVYAAMADLGVALGRNKSESHPCTREDVMKLRAIDSPIDGHPNPALGVWFFDAATGSLGQGLSVAAGVASAARMDKTDRNVFCLIGDGESREGQIWEAMDFIADHRLTNCITIFNCNELGQSDWVSYQQSAETLAKKAEAFGFVVRMIDGHDPQQIRDVLRELPVIKNGHKPLCIVAKTVKGWGSPTEQGMGKHGHPVKKDDLPKIFSELDTAAKELINGPDTFTLKVSVPAPSQNANSASPIRTDILRAFADAGLGNDLEANRPIAPRKAYGAALLALASADRRVVGLDADVKNSTYAEWLYKKNPGQFVECRIAEQNMFSVAAGLAAAGKIPFCSTFAKFVVRGYDQVEMAINSGANLKIVGTHAGITLAADGPSQMSLPDCAFFRSFAHVKNYHGETAVRYFYPSDAISAYRQLELMANFSGCGYLRALRAETKTLYKPDDQFEVGGYKLLREGKDGIFIAAGYMVHECLKASDDLAKSGRRFGVVDAYSMPLKDHSLVEVIRKNGNYAITVEDNYTGGLDAEVATLLALSGSGARYKHLFVRNIPKSGREPQDVLAYCNLDAASIVKSV